MKGKHFRHERAGEAVYDASKHKGTDDGIITNHNGCVCVCEGWLCADMCVREFSFGYLSVRFVIYVVSGWQRDVMLFKINVPVISNPICDADMITGEY